MTRVVDGQKYFVVDNGNAYREVEPGKSWEYVSTVFNPEEVKQSYVSEQGITYRIAPDTHQRFEVQRELNESFDDLKPGLPGLMELVREERLKWGTFTLQSPKAPTVAQYVSHRKELLAGNASFRDCLIEPTLEQGH